MRDFVVVGNLAATTPDFSLEDIPSTSGRIDILCRCINSAFVLSHGIRRDVQVYLIFRGGKAPKTVHLRGRDLRHLNPDERTTATPPPRRPVREDPTSPTTPSSYRRSRGRFWETFFVHRGFRARLDSVLF